MRNIDGSIFKDDYIGVQHQRLRLLWIGLILAVADDQGRMEDKPLWMKLEIFPFDAKVTLSDIDTDLRALHKHHKIIRYTSGGKRLIQIVNWWRYQAGAQWASRSHFGAPPKWTDRIRCHEKGHGQSIVSENWDRSGGLNSKRLPSRLPSRKPAASQPLPSREHEHEHEDKHEEEHASMDSTTGSNGTARPQRAPMPAASLHASKPDAMPIPDQTALKWVKPVLASLGIKGKRLETTSAELATRNLNGTLKHYLLGTIASVYADTRKANKPVIVAMRIESREAPLPEYAKPETWSVIPKHILAAAGIDDLRELYTRPELQHHIPTEVTAVPMPEDVREKLSALVKQKSRRK